MSLSAGVITALSSALANLTPGQLNLLGGHLTQAQEMQALQVLDTMASNPATASSFLSQLAAVPNVPPTVTNWVDQAIANPAQFGTYIAQAKNALLSTSIGGLQL